MESRQFLDINKKNQQVKHSHIHLKPKKPQNYSENSKK